VFNVPTSLNNAEMTFTAKKAKKVKSSSRKLSAPKLAELNNENCCQGH